MGGIHQRQRKGWSRQEEQLKARGRGLRERGTSGEPQFSGELEQRVGSGECPEWGEFLTAQRVGRGQKVRSHTWKALSAPGSPRKEAKGVPQGCQAEEDCDPIMSLAAV